MTTTSAFWDRHAKSYAKRPISDQDTYEKKLEITRSYLRPDMDVLELGCGTGSTALIHAPFVRHIRAVDVSEKMLEIARTKAADQGIANVTFERSSVEALPAGDGSYDVVMAHSILHLIEDKEAAIAQIHRMLKPGGVFVSSTACLGGMMPWLRPVLAIGKFLGLLPMVKFFTIDELTGAMTDAGFRIDRQWLPGKRKALFVVAVKP